MKAPVMRRHREAVKRLYFDVAILTGVNAVAQVMADAELARDMRALRLAADAGSVTVVAAIAGVPFNKVDEGPGIEGATDDWLRALLLSGSEWRP